MNAFTTIGSDIRLGLRLFAKRPGQTALAVLLLSLGVGLTTAMVSIIYGTFLRGLPFEDADRFVIIDRSNPAADLPRAPVPLLDYLSWRSQQTSFDDLAAWFGNSETVVGEGVPPAHFNGAYVTINFFGLIKVQPAMGRGFLPGEDQLSAPPVVVISHRVWTELFNADPKILGRSIQVSSRFATVVGVMPAGFEFPLLQDLWQPMRIPPTSKTAGMPLLQVFGKLKKGVPLQQARTGMTALAERLAREQPETHAGFGTLLSPYTYGYTDEGLRRSQELLLAAVFAVLLLACVNAASLLLGQSVRRLDELAVRTALGASRRRLVTQLLTEAGMLALAGGLLGILVARWAIDSYLRIFDALVFNFWMDIRLDPVAFLAAAAACGLAVIVTGLPAALLSSRTRPAEALKQGARVGSVLASRAFRALSVAEIALSFALLLATGLMIQSILNLGRVNVGPSPDKVLLGQLQLNGPVYDQRSAQVRFFRDLAAQIEAIPGVRAAGLTSIVPGMEDETAPFEIEGRAARSAGAALETHQAVVSPGYFDVFGLKPVDGRLFLAADREEAPAVVVVSRAFARRFFPGEHPVGRRVRLETSGPWRTIVGVVPDLALGGIQGAAHDGLYIPLAQTGGRWMELVVRAEGDPLLLSLPVRRAAASVDPGMVVFWLSSLKAAMDEQTLMYRSAALLFSVFGALALFLALVGLYGVMALTVRQKNRDLGIRIALGARPPQVRSLILRDGAWQVALGLLLGAAVAAAGLRLVAGFLFNVEVWNVPLFVATACFIAAAGLLACLPPCLQASRISPVSLLKAE